MFGTDSYGYDFDDIGNRVSHEDAQGTQSYFSNELNQYTNSTGGAAAPPTYDLDGNMESDEKWIYTWNGENRLVAMQSKSLTNGAPRLEFAYDYMGRRFSKEVSAYDTATSDFQLSTSHVFLYDGWNLVAETELNPQSEIVNRKCYTWGLDLSLTQQGAGGVGGLLAQYLISTNPSEITAYYAVADANGNITDYVDGSGNVAAHYEYDAFGKIVNTLTSSDEVLPFRFSSKYEDVETELNYYGYRYYATGNGRWLNRDPIGERGGFNLYSFTGNRPIIVIDRNGLDNYGGGQNDPPAIVTGTGSLPIDFKLDMTPLPPHEDACSVIMTISHGTQVKDMLRGLEDRSMCRYGGIGCDTIIEGEGDQSIGHGFPTQTGYIGWPEFGDTYNEPLNAGFDSFEDMLSAMIASGKKSAKELAKDCKCECSDIKVKVKCKEYERHSGDRFLFSLEQIPECNTTVHTEPCVKNAKEL